jgi:FkbM family methyltransferase
MLNRDSNIIRGGSALFKVVRRMQQSCGLPTSAGIRCGDRVVYLDLMDTRMLWVLPEMMDDSAEHRILRRLLKPGDTFIDIGANHGSFSLVASEIVGDKGMVIAFEPQPKLAHLLTQSLTATAKSPFKVHEAGCSDRMGATKFFIPRAGSGSAGVFQDFSGRSGHCRLNIKLTTIDESLSNVNVTGSLMMKIDVEGSEFAALMGARAMIEKFRPPILFELNPDSSKAAGHGPGDLLELFARLGYQKFCEIDEFPKTVRVSELKVMRQRNLLALHND